MNIRTIKEIEAAFREMGLTETTWGQPLILESEAVAEHQPLVEHILIRIETTTTPLEAKNNADLA